MLVFVHAIYGLFAGLIFNQYIDVTGVGILENLCLIFLAIILTIVLHELGHYIAAKISGYKFILFRIFSITFIKENGKIKRKSFDIPGTFGQNLMVPKQNIGEEYPYLLYHFGGSIMNLLEFIICTIIMLKSGDSLRIFSYYMAVIAGFAILNNAIPISKEIENDGMNAIKSYKNKSHRLLMHIVLIISENALNDKGVSELPSNAIETIKNDENQKYLEFNAILADYYAERDNFKKAEEIIEESLTKEVLSSDLQRLVTVGELLFYKLINDDEDGINKYDTEEFEKFRKKILPKLINTYHIEYAFALHERDFEKAKNIKMNFEKYKEKYPFSGQSNLIEKQIKYADEKIGEK